MKTDCQWVETRLEDYLSDQSDPETRTRIRSHADTCEACRTEIEEYRHVDRLVSAYFGQQLERAYRAPRIVRGWLARGAALAGAGAIVLILLVRFPWAGDQPIAPATGQTAMSAATGSGSDGDVKDPAIDEANNRAKPGVVDPADVASASASAIEATGTAVAAPEFSVMDPAGYALSLADYQGTVLVFAVFDEKQEGAAAFQQAYETFGTSGTVRMLGVARNSGSRPGGVTFPLGINSGSTLMGAQAGEFVVVTQEGRVYTRGSLIEGSFLTSLASALGELER